MEGSVDIWKTRHNDDHIVEYHTGDPLTRDNFVDLLVQSFAFSRTSHIVQRVYLDWQSLRGNFDWELNVSQFRQLGGWSVLNSYEKKYLLNAISSVDEHHQNTGFKHTAFEGFASDPNGSLNRQLTQLMAPELRDMAERYKSGISPLDSLSKGDLTRIVHRSFFQKKE